MIAVSGAPAPLPAASGCRPCTLYFPLGALAAYKGLWEMAARPFYWDKTAPRTCSRTAGSAAVSDSRPRRSSAGSRRPSRYAPSASGRPHRRRRAAIAATIASCSASATSSRPSAAKRRRGHQRHRAVHEIQLLHQKPVVRGEMDLLVKPPVGPAQRPADRPSSARSSRAISLQHLDLLVRWHAAPPAAPPAPPARCAPHKARPAAL